MLLVGGTIGGTSVFFCIVSFFLFRSISKFGVNLVIRSDEIRNNTPANRVTELSPQILTNTGASMALPNTSPADELSDKNEFAEASSRCFEKSASQASKEMTLRQKLDQS